MKNPKVWRIIKIIVIAFGLFFIVCGVLPSLLFYLVSSDPPKPEIAYYEFPFELVYEIDGEEVTVNDIYVCEYDGIGVNEGEGKYLKWKGYVKKTGDEDFFIKKVNGKKIYCNVGAPGWHYVTEMEYSQEVLLRPSFYIKETSLIWGTSTNDLDEQELSEYGIKLISYKFSDLIDNSFGEQQE